MRIVKITIPFLISLMLHLAVVSLVVALEPQLQNGAGEEGQGGQGNDAMFSGDIIPKQVEVELVEPEKLTVLDSPVEVPETEKPVEGIPECKSWYGGIGVYTRDLPTKTILTLVVSGYPADKAGLGSGDEIVYPPFSKIRGEVGTPVTLYVKKLGTTTPVIMTLTRVKVCEDKP